MTFSNSMFSTKLSDLTKNAFLTQFFQLRPSRAGRVGGQSQPKFFVDVPFVGKSPGSVLFERSNQKCTWKSIYYTSKLN